MEYNLITIEDLFFLLAKSGMEACYCFMPDHDIDRTKESEHRSMARLYQNSYIDWEQDQIHVNEPVASMISVVEKSTNCLRLDYCSPIPVSYMYYLSQEQVVEMTKNPDLSEVKFILLDTEAFRQRIREILSELVSADLSNVRDYKALEVEVLLECQCYGTRTGALLQRLKLEEQGLVHRIVIQKGDEEKHLPFKTGAISDLLLEMLGGNHDHC